MDPFQILLNLLEYSWFSMLLLPVVLTLLTMIWKILARPASPTAEDGALGFDLIIGAGGTQLSFLGELVAFEQNGPLTDYRLAMGIDLLVILSIVLFLTAVVVRFLGYDRRTKQLDLRFGVQIPNYIGFIMVVAVFAGNVFAEQTFPYLCRSLLP
jgi:hypothetical protein